MTLGSWSYPPIFMKISTHKQLSGFISLLPHSRIFGVHQPLFLWHSLYFNSGFQGCVWGVCVCMCFPFWLKQLSQTCGTSVGSTGVHAIGQEVHLLSSLRPALLHLESLLRERAHSMIFLPRRPIVRKAP